MFNVVVETPITQLEAMNLELATTVERMNALTAVSLPPVGVRMVEVLATPPPPASNYYPLRWKSERQRRYVMAMLKERGDLPYQRTGGLEQAWFSALEFTADGGTLTVANPTQAALFVQGDAQQPMFMQIPWVQLDDAAVPGWEQARMRTDMDWDIVTGARS